LHLLDDEGVGDVGGGHPVAGQVGGGLGVLDRRPGALPGSR
jgi:hypothetical protein